MKDLSEDFAAKKATLEDNKRLMLMEKIPNNREQDFFHQQ